jgi:hypothetical protein
VPALELKPNHKLVQSCYAALAQFDHHRVTRETAVRQPFLDLLRAAAGPRGLTVEADYPLSGARGFSLSALSGKRAGEGRGFAALRDGFSRPHGYSEAKDSGGGLEAVTARSSTAPTPVERSEWTLDRTRSPAKRQQFSFGSAAVREASAAATSDREESSFLRSCRDGSGGHRRAPGQNENCWGNGWLCPDLNFLERGCARSVSRSAAKLLRLVFDRVALRQNRTLPNGWRP